MRAFIIYLFVIFSLVFTFFTVARILLKFQLLDFSYYHQSVQYLLNNQSPYTNGQFVLNYPPTALLFFFPFGILPYIWGEKIWTILSVIALGGSILVILKSQEKHISFLTYLLFFSFAFILFPVRFNLGMGQVNLFILFLLTLSFFYHRIKRLYWAGIFLGIATAIKITPIFLLLFFIRKKEFKAVLSAVATLILLVILGIFLFGQPLLKEFVFQVFPSIPTLGTSIYYNQALTGFLTRLNISDNIIWAINYLSLGILVVISFFVTREKKQQSLLELLEFGLFIILFLIGGGLAWQHHFVLLVIPFSGVFLYLLKDTNLRFLILALISYMLVAYNIKNPQDFTGVSSLILSHVLFGTIILYLLCIKMILVLKRRR